MQKLIGEIRRVPREAGCKWITSLITFGMILLTAPIVDAQDLLYFSQIADGTFASGFWKTSLFINNPAPPGGATAIATITLTKSDGNPFVLNFLDDRNISTATTSQIVIQVPPGESRKLVSTAKNTLSVGYATVSFNSPVIAEVIFSQFDSSGRLVAEAGVPSAAPLNRQTVFVDTMDGFKTGIAYANPSDGSAEITLRLLNRSGQEIAITQHLLPRQHKAVFISELFSTAPEMVGTLQIVSKTPLIAVGLRFDPTFTVFTTLPANSLAEF